MNQKQTGHHPKEDLSDYQIDKYIENMLDFDIQTELSSKDNREQVIKINKTIESFSKLDIGEQAHKEKDNNQKRLRPKKNQNIIFAGFLQRQGKSFFKTKDIQYVVLTPLKLYFFENESRLRLLSCISFKIHSAAISLEDSIITILLYDIQRIISIKALSQPQTIKWFAGISEVIEQNKIYKKIQFLQNKHEIYEQKDALTEQQLFQTAETGDIILMSTVDSQSAVQRFVTNSEYDHIALVVKFNQEIKVFQSNANEGVNLYDWHQFHSDFNQYEKMSLRKLHYAKKEQMEPCVIKFIKENLGNQYHLTAFKLFRKTSDDAPPPKRGFFCSELVAKIYKNVGLLCPNRASSNYWPIDFTERGGLELKESAYLGQQKLIILKKHLKYS